ncbi:unnamed protein product [Peniophora sp. CBMAI 1063]|nr:unnamed protein product [Peniophora sp. CBMAI 1063]
MSAVRTDELPASGTTTTTPTTAFIIDDDGFWVPSPAYDTNTQAGQNIDSTPPTPPPPPPPAPMPFSSLWPFILQETLCKGSPPFTLADRDAAYREWYTSQSGKRKEILDDELAVGYELCAERFCDGKARKRARYEAFWDEKGRRPAGPSPLRNVVHAEKPSRRTLRRAPASGEHHHQPVVHPPASSRPKMNSLRQVDRTGTKPSAISIFEELLAAQRPRNHHTASENIENVLSLAASKRHVRSFAIGHTAPLVPVNALR